MEWGYLKAGDRQYGEGTEQYDLIGDDVLAALPPPPPPVLPHHNGHPEAAAQAFSGMANATSSPLITVHCQPFQGSTYFVGAVSFFLGEIILSSDILQSRGVWIWVQRPMR